MTFWMAALMAPVLLGVAPVEPGRAPHGGVLAPTAEGELELLVGPERLALFPLDAQLHPRMPTGATARLLSPNADPIELQPTGDHFEAANPFGTGKLNLVAVISEASGASATRFEVTGGNSTFHDHRPFHGGYVGMAGERHLELALVPAGKSAELQLYLTDAYRQPLPVEGVRAELDLTVGDKLHEKVQLHPAADCLTARIDKPRGALDVHVDVKLPTDPTPIEMDFYIDPAGPSPERSGGAVEVRVADNGFVPARIEAIAGKPLTLRFLRTSNGTCATKVVFPAQGIERDLPLDRPVEVELVPHRGEIAFSCGMRMFKGAVVAN